ncbi:tRNA(Ile)-lysidine synthase [Arthrobacter sp. Hiyo8]|nr:tRNA(Ile)-lysidine synthase [Arthrobacter sp. Hiyo8]
MSVAAVVVDHQLQEGSAEVAARTVAILEGLGLSPVQLRTVEVAATGFVRGGSPGRPARGPRSAATELDCGAILLGHTLDDQAEQVLLGLARGSGTRSLAGMRPARGKLLRPFLGLRRAETLEICEVEELETWHDPSNADPAFARSRTRVEVMPLLEDKLGPGVAESLARTAAILQQDADFLEHLAAESYAGLVNRSDDGVWLPEDRLRELSPR